MSYHGMARLRVTQCTCTVDMPYCAIHPDAGSDCGSDIQAAMAAPGGYNRSRACPFCGGVTEWRSQDEVPQRCAHCRAPARESSERI